MTGQMTSGMNRQGRATQPATTEAPHFSSASPHRGMVHEEPLLFEAGDLKKTGVDLPAIPQHKNRLGSFTRKKPAHWPGFSEPEAVRHFTRLSQRNFGIDSAFYPLGSCTMKHNPRLNEKMARLPGFADIHPLQPLSTVKGAVTLMHELAQWLLQLTGMNAVSLTPAAGAHGEFCGMAAIATALQKRGQGHRRIVLVPDSAHGTNPATAAALGFTVKTIKGTADGRVDLAALRAVLDAEGDNVAALMITNPNTCGLFERDIIDISGAVHQAGAFVYCDGANFNAIVGRVRPADLGVDAMHINLHKTFSTPHGGGGPGSGPVVFAESLAPYLPVPRVVRLEEGFVLEEEAPDSFGRLRAFHGQMGMFVRALAYILAHGGDGLKAASGDAVLNANYILAKLKGTLNAPFPGFCMHEALFDDRSFKDTGITTIDLAKGLLDRGMHPMTMYFPLVVPGALLIEPTESETKATLDIFIASIEEMVAAAKAGDVAALHAAPILTPRRRLDETRAARAPKLRWHASAAGDTAKGASSAA